MGKTEFTFEGKEGAIYDDGEIYVAGERQGKLYNDGDLYINGRQSGKIYRDGDIYINGENRGELYSNGDIYIDGQMKGKAYKKKEKRTAKQSVPSSSGGYIGGGGFLAETGVLGLAAVLFGIICVCASYIMWTDQLWKTFDRYMEIGWRAYLAKGMFLVIPICSLILQIYKIVKQKLGLGGSFSVGLFIQSVSTFLCITCASCLIDGINDYLDMLKGWGIVAIIFACICMALFPAGIGSIIGTLVKKVYWKSKKMMLHTYLMNGTVI